MRALLDVNVLLARLDLDHTHHDLARNWLSHNRDHGWATCPLTENGFARIIAQPRYSNPIAISEAAALLRTQIGISGHEFWEDDISITDGSRFDHRYILRPSQITDVYLLALAVKNEGRFVTFDRGIPLAAARGATGRHLVVL
jgi:toxin-antitoxin system PIN domain toxin